MCRVRLSPRRLQYVIAKAFQIRGFCVLALKMHSKHASVNFSFIFQPTDPPLMTLTPSQEGPGNSHRYVNSGGPDKEKDQQKVKMKYK